MGRRFGKRGIKRYGPQRTKALRKQRETLKALRNSKAKNMLEFQQEQRERERKREQRRRTIIKNKRIAVARNLGISKRRFSAEQIHEIRRLFSEGMSYAELARQNGCKSPAIKNIVTRKTYRDIKSPYPVVAPKRGVSRFSRDQIREIRRIYVKGMSYRELGRRYGCSFISIKNIVKGETYRDVQ